MQGGWWGGRLPSRGGAAGGRGVREFSDPEKSRRLSKDDRRTRPVGLELANTVVSHRGALTPNATRRIATRHF